jgi:hypothetical protein
MPLGAHKINSDGSQLLFASGRRVDAKYTLHRATVV